ncbi:MAG: VWA domain-containing protein [Caulobacteraceae bacterium]
MSVASDTERGMQRTLEDFLRALRAADIKVSPAEAIDAHQAVDVVGYASRELFKDALCATLAKTADEVDRFDVCFETFFQREMPSNEQLSDQGDPQQNALANEALDENEAGAELAQMLLNGDAAGIAQALEEAANRAGVQEIRLATQRSRYTRRIMDEIGLADIERILSQAKARQDAQGEALAERLTSGRQALFDEAGKLVARQLELYAKETGRKMREELLAQKTLTGIDDEDIQMMQSLVRKMAKRLANRYSRQQKKAKKGKLDMGRTMRRSLAFGGIPFEIIWKQEKVDRPKIVVMCDVSKSVAAAAQFLLLFLYSLNEVVDRIHSYAFSGRLVSVDEILAGDDVEKAMFQILRTIGFQQTDYGKALEDFCDLHLDDLDRRTTVIILGDGRTNYANPRLDLMHQIMERSRSVIWLNPEPETYWPTGDSQMIRYARFCHVAKTCNTLNGLERIVEDVLRSYVPK